MLPPASRGRLQQAQGVTMSFNSHPARARRAPAVALAGMLSLAGTIPGIAQAADEEGTPKFEIFGTAQLDYVQDFNRVDPAWDATLRPSKIPTTEGAFGSDGQAI